MNGNLDPQLNPLFYALLFKKSSNKILINKSLLTNFDAFDNAFLLEIKDAQRTSYNL